MSKHSSDSTVTDSDDSGKNQKEIDLSNFPVYKTDRSDSPVTTPLSPLTFNPSKNTHHKTPPQPSPIEIKQNTNTNKTTIQEEPPNPTKLSELERKLETAENIISQLYIKTKELETEKNNSSPTRGRNRRNLTPNKGGKEEDDDEEIKNNKKDEMEYNQLYVLHSKTENYLKDVIVSQKQTIDKLDQKIVYLTHETEMLKQNKLKGYNINELLTENKDLKTEVQLLRKENLKLRSLYEKKAIDYNNRIFISIQKLADLADKNTQKYIYYLEEQLENNEYYNNEIQILSQDKIDSLENELADSYVTNKMLEENISQLYKEIHLRDHLEEKIEICIQSILQRLSYLEYKNIK